MNALPQTSQNDVMESVIVKGDLAKLTPEERASYYMQVCRSIGLNPMTRPFEYITLNGKLTLYARRDAADQLRKINRISLEIISREVNDGLFTVHVRALTPEGRQDEDFGVVNIAGLRGEPAANAVLKAVTKAKRRVTLSISGLGFLDETEVDDIRPVRSPPQPSPLQIAKPHPVADADDPDIDEMPEQSDGEHNQTDNIAEWDAKLTEASKEGFISLKNEWQNVPSDLKPTLKSSLDRRHKPAATLVDKERAEVSST